MQPHSEGQLHTAGHVGQLEPEHGSGKLREIGEHRKCGKSRDREPRTLTSRTRARATSKLNGLLQEKQWPIHTIATLTGAQPAPEQPPPPQPPAPPPPPQPPPTGTNWLGGCT